MAPSYSELGLNIGDSANLTRYGAKKLDKKYNLGTNTGDLVTVIDKKDYCQAEEMAFLRFDESKAIFIINKNWKIFEEPKK